MANNKIVYGDQTLIDLTSDTVTPETLAMGETAHSASGAQIVGTMSPSGPTTILTPSNSNPPAIIDGTAYTADGNGYAIKSYNTKNPSSTPVSVSNGEIDKMGGNGYLINSYANITPSKDGTYFSSGMKKMSASGYAYSSKPTLTETVLWTNPDKDTGTSSTNFSPQQPITLSQSYKNFTMLGVYWQLMYGNASTSGVNAIRVSDFPVVSTSNQAPRLVFGYYGGSNYKYNYMRSAYATSNTTLYIGQCIRYTTSSAGTSNTRVIPIKIIGYKVE
jgi:hypothetical protein